MSAPTAQPLRQPARPPSRFGALFGYTLRSCIPPRRWVGVLLACVGCVLFGLLAHALDEETRQHAFGLVAVDGIFGLLVPVAALVIGDAILGAEVRSGTFHFTWLSPAPVGHIVLARWAAGSAVAVVTIAPSVALAAVVAGAPGAAAAAFLAALAGATAYMALFILIGAITRRTAVWSLAVVFLVERLLGAALTGIAQLSPTWESQAVFAGLLDDEGLRREGIPWGWSAVARLALITVVTLAIATWRMRHMRLSGASD